MLDAAGRFSLGLDLQGVVAAIIDVTAIQGYSAPSIGSVESVGVAALRLVAVVNAIPKIAAATRRRRRTLTATRRPAQRDDDRATPPGH